MDKLINELFNELNIDPNSIDEFEIPEVNTGDPVKCWNCGSFCMLNEKRYTSDHPCADQSFYCSTCKDDILTCDLCEETSSDWWYDMHELWDDWYEWNGICYCQNCYFDKGIYEQTDEYREYHNCID